VSPLLNSFEAACVDQVPGRVTDSFGAAYVPGPEPDAALLGLRDACAATEEPAAIRAVLDTLSWCLFDSMLRAAPRETLARVAELTAPFEDELSAAYRRILAAVRQYAAAI
jgi:hypothetical protein